MSSPHTQIRAHTLFGDISWYGIGQGVVQICSLLGIIIVSRYLGPELLGLYSFVQNYTTIFLSVLLGLNLYFTWDMVTASRSERLVQEQFWYKVYLSCVLIAVGSVIAYMVLPPSIAALTLCMFLPSIFYATSAVFHHDVSIHESRKIAFAYTVSALLLLVLKYLGVVYHAPLAYFVFISGLDSVLAGSILFVQYVYRHGFSILQLRVPWYSLCTFLRTHRYGIIVVVIWQFLIKVDQLTLALFSKSYALGIYAATTKIAEVPHFLIGVLYTACLPYLHSTISREEEGKSARFIFKAYFILGLLLSCFVIVFAPQIVTYLYGNDFLATIPVLRVYALGFPGMFLALYYFSHYGAKEKHKFQAYIFFACALGNALLVVILTHYFDLVGTAFSTAITYSLLALILYYSLRNTK